MTPLRLPHKAPVRFAKSILSKESSSSAKVAVEFAQIPSLAMLVEAAAQSCAALEDESKEGYLLALKSIKLLIKPTKKSYEIAVSKEHDFGNMVYIRFEVVDGEIEIANGYLTVALA